jgi:polygalacturonase
VLAALREQPFQWAPDRWCWGTQFMTASNWAPDLDRRVILRGIIASLGLVPALLGRRGAAQTEDPWAHADQIAKSIHLPAIPDRTFVITDYGAVGDGKKDCTTSIRRALVAARDAGGGHVLVPAGKFLTGAIELYTRIDLHLEANSTLAFKTDPAAYLPVVLTRFGGQDCYNYRPFIRAYKRSNISISGSGVIDGQADLGHWWPWRGSREFGWVPGQPNQSAALKRLREQGAAGVPVTQRVYGDGSYLRPSLVRPYGCTNVLIEGITLKNAPWWHIHALFSTDVTVRNVTIESQGPTNDGCDLESSQRVLVEGCTFKQRDDKVAIKSGFGRDGVLGAPGAPFSPRPTADVVVRNCRVAGYGAAIAVGSEIGGGAERIYAEGITNLSTDLPLSLVCLIKSSTYRGGYASGVWLRNAQVAACNIEAIFLTYTYNQDDLLGPYRPRFENINLDAINCGGSRQALIAAGQPDLRIFDLRLTNSSFLNSQKSALSVRNVDGFVMQNVTVNGKTPPVIN